MLHRMVQAWHTNVLLKELIIRNDYEMVHTMFHRVIFVRGFQLGVKVVMCTRRALEWNWIVVIQAMQSFVNFN